MSGKSSEGDEDFDLEAEAIERHVEEERLHDRPPAYEDLEEREEKDGDAEDEKVDLYDTSEYKRDDPSMRLSGEFAGDDSFGMATAEIQRYLLEKGIQEEEEEEKVDSDLDEPEHKHGERIDETERKKPPLASGIAAQVPSQAGAEKKAAATVETEDSDGVPLDASLIIIPADKAKGLKTQEQSVAAAAVGKPTAETGKVTEGVAQEGQPSSKQPAASATVTADPVQKPAASAAPTSAAAAAAPATEQPASKPVQRTPEKAPAGATAGEDTKGPAVPSTKVARSPPTATTKTMPQTHQNAPAGIGAATDAKGEAAPSGKVARSPPAGTNKHSAEAAASGAAKAPTTEASQPSARKGDAPESTPASARSVSASAAAGEPAEPAPKTARSDASHPAPAEMNAKKATEPTSDKPSVSRSPRADTGTAAADEGTVPVGTGAAGAAGEAAAQGPVYMSPAAAEPAPRSARAQDTEGKQSETKQAEAKPSTAAAGASAKATPTASGPAESRKGAPARSAAQPEVPRSSRFKKNREAAEGSGNVGGDPVPGTMPPETLAVKLQSTWRGRQGRRMMKVRQISALSIQRLVRGLLVREKSSAQLKHHREKIKAEQVRKTRLAHIRSKEKDLALLSNIPAEQFAGFERLRRDNGAKTIQRNWRAVQDQRAGARAASDEAKLDEWLGDDMLLGTRAAATADVRKFPRGYAGKAGKPSFRGAPLNTIQGASISLLGSTAATEARALREQKSKLQQHMVGVVTDAIAEQKRDELFAKYKAAQTPGTGAGTSAATPAPTPAAEAKGWKTYEVEVEALALAQLQRKIREAAHNRTRQQDVRAAKQGFRGAFGTGQARTAGMDVSQSFDATSGAASHRAGASDGTGGAPRWGARRNYQDLMEAQIHANVLLQEHQFALPHLAERQAARHKTLGNCQHLLKELQQPLSLDDARSFIQQQALAKDPTAPKAASESKLAPEVEARAASWLIDEELWKHGAGAGDVTGRPAVPAGANAQFMAPSAVEFATTQHVNALHALRTSSIVHADGGRADPTADRAAGRTKHWGAVALPLPLHVVSAPAATATTAPSSEAVRSSGEWKDLRGSFNRSIDGETSKKTGTAAGIDAESLSQRLLTDAKLFRPLASQWARGTDVEDSLYWIAYATQPSNIIPQPITPSPLEPEGASASATGAAAGTAGADATAPGAAGTSAAQAQAAAAAAGQGSWQLRKEHEELRRRIAVEAMGLSQRVPRVRRQCEHEQARISRLAEVYQAEMFAYLRREHALSAQLLLGGERAQQQYVAASRIQAVARGASARTRVAGLRAQRRVMMALQNLLHEIAVSEGHPPPPPLPTAHGYAAQQPTKQAGAQRGSAVFNNLLSNLTNMGAPAPAVGSGHSAASLSRASSTTLAGLAIASKPPPGGAHALGRMGVTQMSALTDTPGAYMSTMQRSTQGTATPTTGTGRVGYAESMPGPAPYPLQNVLPPVNRQYSGAHTDGKNLVSNVNNININVSQNTPSYFSPLVSGMNHNEPESARMAEAEYTWYGDAKGAGIASTPSSRPATSSVVNRGAWNNAGDNSKRNGGAAHGAGTAMDRNTGAIAMGLSSPSKQTFNILNESFTAGEQVPNESLQLSASLNSTQDYGTTPFSPQTRRASTGVSFSLEHPDAIYHRDNAIPTGSQLRRSDEMGSPGRPGYGQTPGTPGSVALSEFSYTHEDDLNPGAAYVSSPGHSAGGHSLSRSLSASFGQVSGALPMDTADAKESRRASTDHGKGASSPGGKGLSPRAPQSPPRSRYPYDPSPRSPNARPQPRATGALSPAALNRFNQEGTSDDDSVEGLDIPFSSKKSQGSAVAGGAGIKGFRIHGTAKAAAVAQQAAVAVSEAMAVVERRFRTSTCSVGGFIASALAADVRNFEKSAALNLLQNMAMVTGVAPLIRWLQRFRYDAQQAAAEEDNNPPGSARAGPNTSLVLGVGEIAVQDAALLIAELAAELRLMDVTAPAGAKSEEEREKEMLFNLIQTCVLMKLLGAGSDSGRLKIGELSALLEDAWVLAVPINGVRVSQLLAQLRFSLLQQATRKACHPRKLFDDVLKAANVTVAASSARGAKPHAALDQWLEEEKIPASGVAVVFEKIFATSPTLGYYAADKALCQELAQAAVRFVAWNDSEDCVSVAELRSLVCSLCSFRVLQKRLQVWFRAVPNMHPSLVKNVAAFLNADKISNGMVSVPVFVRASEASGVPLSQSECFMLAQLLTRRRQVSGAGGAGAVSAASTGAEGEQGNSYVDVALLQRIKAGDFLHAALV